MKNQRTRRLFAWLPVRVQGVRLWLQFYESLERFDGLRWSQVGKRMPWEDMAC